jgi:GDPmannose 4,6-dehydratase
LNTKVLRALIVGCYGQDGSYLTECLREKGYDVIGIDSQGASTNGVLNVDIQNKTDVVELLAEARPDEIYYLAAFHQSAEGADNDPHDLCHRSFEINTLALNHFLYGVLVASEKSRLFYAASSRVFGNPETRVQDERTLFNPICPYGISKASGAHLCRYYRTEHGLYSSVGILYNHESHRRSASFVSKKIVKAAVAIKKGLQSRLVLGSLDALIDWGYAPDYVAAMWAILQTDQADDFIIASGTLHSVREFVEAAFSAVELDWTRYVAEDEQLLSRRRQPGTLCGDSNKLQFITGWRPRVSFDQMVRLMVEKELE